MTEAVKVHETSTTLVTTAPAELDAGCEIALKVKVSCPLTCDLRGRIVKIIDQDAAPVQEIELTEFDGTVNETDEVVVKAPVTPGEWTWRALFPAQEEKGVLHQESSAPFSFSVKPHATSMAVWDVPSPIAFGDEFTIKVGVKCSAECKLTDKKIEIYDHEGGKVATENLGDVPWPGTGALYWGEVKLKAPGTEGYYTWEAKFPEPHLEVPHEAASHSFRFRTARRPEHVVRVEVVDKDTKTPIKNADVLLHPYRSYTDERGVAKLEVPRGEYNLWVSKVEYETFQTAVKVANDVGVRAELVLAPVPDESG